MTEHDEAKDAMAATSKANAILAADHPTSWQAMVNDIAHAGSLPEMDAPQREAFKQMVGIFSAQMANVDPEVIRGYYGMGADEVLSRYPDLAGLARAEALVQADARVKASRVGLLHKLLAVSSAAVNYLDSLVKDEKQSAGVRRAAAVDILKLGVTATKIMGKGTGDDEEEAPLQEADSNQLKGDL